MQAEQIAFLELPMELRIEFILGIALKFETSTSVFIKKICTFVKILEA